MSCCFAQDLPLGLMDDIYDFITKFSTRLDEVEEVCSMCCVVSRACGVWCQEHVLCGV